MASTTLINKAKMARRISTFAFDDEINDLLDAAAVDLGIAGVIIPPEASVIVERAQITYFLMHFGEPDEYDRLKKSYDEQKAQLATHTGFTKWTAQ